MSSSKPQLIANRANAQRSTGPLTANGRVRASANATRHGLFSGKLLLEDEDPAEFDTLLSELQTALRPAGAVELALVERVAVAMWRQRRLVQAETAALFLTRQPRQIAVGVSSELGLSHSAELKEENLAPFDAEQAQRCQKIIEEIECLEQIDPKSIPQLAPLVFAQLKSDAEQGVDDVEAYLKDYAEGLTGYVGELASWCREELCKAKERPHVLMLVGRLRATRLVLPPAGLELFTRYQTTLDNQLYKALKALREAQDWRIKTLDSMTDPIRA